MANATVPLIRRFQDGEPYAQEEPGEAQFRWLLKKDELPGLQMGLVTLVGPIHKTPAAHDEFDQVYLIQAGSAIVHVGDHSQQVEGPTVVAIPKGTRHSVEVADGESIQYAFVNRYG